MSYFVKQIHNHILRLNNIMYHHLFYIIYKNMGKTI